MATKTWLPHYNKILMMVNEGKSNTFIAAEMKMSPYHISRIINWSEFKSKLQSIQNQVSEATIQNIVEQDKKRFAFKDKAREVLEDAAVDAAIRISKLVKNRKTRKAMSLQEKRLIFEASKDILDRVGLKAVEVVETREREYSPEEMVSAQKTLIEMQSMVDRLSNRHSEYLLTNKDIPTQEELNET